MNNYSQKESASIPGDRPLISVIMSVYNCESTVWEAMESIADQTYENWELIICDDASTDRTAEVIQAFTEERGRGRVKVLKNDNNLKLAASLNKCLEESQGEYIARMDGDDISAPDRFERQLDFMKKNPEVDLVGSSMRRFNANGLGPLVHPASPNPDKWTMAKSSSSPFCHATILARREVFQDVNNYTVSWRTERGQDMDLWFKFFAAGKIGKNLPEPLYFVREDEAAVRRRTPRARFGGFVTRVIGNWSLGYPPHAYLPALVGLLKIFIPYRIFDWQREQSGKLDSLKTDKKLRKS